MSEKKDNGSSLNVVPKPGATEPPKPQQPEPAGASSSPAEPPGVGAVEPGSKKAQIIDALKTVHDPEIPVNIYDLGLIYDLKLDEAGGRADVKMTLTAPGCPVAGMIVENVRKQVAGVEGVEDVNVELVWDPPWCQDRMSDAAKLQLNLL